MTIDWARMAIPQADGYDTDRLIEMAERRWGGTHTTRTAIEPVPFSTHPDYEAAISHEHLDAIELTLGTWPEASEGFHRFVDVFWPLERVVPMRPAPKGCMSGHIVLPSGRRGVYVTVFDIDGAREGLLHEWGHLRLEAAGIDLATHDGRLLDHADDELFISPIRKDTMRPMSAVLHGFYAWVLLSQGDLMAASDRAVDVVSLVEMNVPKIEEGILLLDAIRTTADGAQFITALLGWAEVVVSQMWDLVGRDRRDALYASHRAWEQTQAISGSPLHEC